jgi:phage portal protein BeeE
MSECLTKTLAKIDGVANSAYETTMARKAVGGAIDFVPSGLQGGLSGWQQQQEFANRYNIMRGWVYAAINALACEGAGQPPVIARLKGSKVEVEGKKCARKRHDRNRLRTSKMTTSARTKAAEQEYEILESHLLVDLLEKPNAFQNKWQFVYSFVCNLVLTGWAYVVVSSSKRKGGKLELYSLPTTWVKPKHDKGPFSEFEVKNPKAVGVEPVTLDARQVGFAHLPNPADPLASLAPASTQMAAIRIDDHIQTSQSMFFENGIFPSVIITMGSGFSDTEGRPVLTRDQRSMIQSALRRRYASDLNQGNAVIVDGLIDKIEPFQASHREMGWDKSETKIRTRILSAFGVHPFILGEPVSVGGYAQAVIIQERFFKRVNTYLDMLGTLLTNLLGGIEGNERLLIWFEVCQAFDRSLRQSMLLTMRKEGDISQNELRAEAGFPPDEDLNQAVVQPTMMQGVGQVLGMLGQGAIQREQAVAVFEAMGIPTEMAEDIAGVGLPEPEPPAPPEPPGTRGDRRRIEAVQLALGKGDGGA